ncbi:tol-pal system protein YbgF [Geobacter sp. DSM 9736]|uniref:tol-pal system protein YbgF n=1 Tax=Geobacter sp. DSM 9736 TaxID=1277350 RepID=UPI000B50D771|nr:tol-pal system protein YbgF [Geobacter sp. DSM 9736]SNB48113.1 tol-pal system protein YbgF [Geobacter sp. DSM 9736]
MRIRVLVCACSAMLCISGCGANDLMVKRQTEIEARMEQLIQRYASADARLAEMSGELKDVQAQVRQNSADLQEVKPLLSEMKSAVDVVRQKPLETQQPSSTALPPSRIEVINGEAAPPDSASKIQDLYMKAFGLYSANEYQKAIEAFEAFIGTHPESEYAGNARYWIGECFYTQKDFRSALESFRRVIAEYPKGNKVPDAMLKLGLTQINLNEPVRARETLLGLVERYPKSQAAAKARERLGKR